MIDTASDTSARAALAQSTSFCTVGAPLTPIVFERLKMEVRQFPNCCYSELLQPLSSYVAHSSQTANQ